MADQEQLLMLKRSVSEWNEWRLEHPEVVVDLRGADVYGADLSGANLYRANLAGADLRGADLHEVDLRGADTSGAYGLPLMGPVEELREEPEPAAHAQDFADAENWRGLLELAEKGLAPVLSTCRDGWTLRWGRHCEVPDERRSGISDDPAALIREALAAVKGEPVAEEPAPEPATAAPSLRQCNVCGGMFRTTDARAAVCEKPSCRALAAPAPEPSGPCPQCGEPLGVKAVQPVVPLTGKPCGPWYCSTECVLTACEEAEYETPAPEPVLSQYPRPTPPDRADELRGLAAMLAQMDEQRRDLEDIFHRLHELENAVQPAAPAPEPGIVTHSGLASIHAAAAPEPVTYAEEASIRKTLAPDEHLCPRCRRVGVMGPEADVMCVPCLVQRLSGDNAEEPAAPAPESDPAACSICGRKVPEVLPIRFTREGRRICEDCGSQPDEKVTKCLFELVLLGRETTALLREGLTYNDRFVQMWRAEADAARMEREGTAAVLRAERLSGEAETDATPTHALD